MKINFKRLINPTHEIVNAFNKWENNPQLRPLMRPNKNQADIDKQTTITMDELSNRLEHCFTYLIYVNEKLIGQMNYQIDFEHLYKQEPDTAWIGIGIGIGESSARNKGIGKKALNYLENQIKADGLKRIELGVFAFNKPAIKLYKNNGYHEIGKVKKFTYWQGKMWSSIHMEKYLN